MVRAACARVREDKEELLREWMQELMRRRAEVLETFEQEGVTRELAFVVTLSETEKVLLYVMDVDDPQRAREAFEQSTLPIDAEHRRVMAEALGERVEVELVYDVQQP